MKNVFYLFALFGLIAAGCVLSNGSRIAGINDMGGFYEGTGQGYRGPITVQVHILEGSISDIVIADSTEDPFVGGAAIEELIEIIIEYDTADIDVISGATQSSRGFLEAVRNALTEN